ncbi:MAG: threonylcarbamoyl-AMP synthase [Desulfobacterales bacterium]|nr:threonylcarbamoyl-AMP synthase [Desulfobacterales bacterium]
MMSQKIVGIDPVNPESDIIAKAGKIIQNNGIVIFPAKCLYGVAADALNEKAVQKVFNLKKRPLNNPILVLIPDRDMLQDLVTTISKPAKKMMDAFWPGNLTLVFEAKDNIPQLLTAGTGKIGVRIPAHPVAKALVEYVGFPITGTSANLSGQNGCSRIDQLVPSIIEHADLVLDAGVLKGGTGSTIVDVTALSFNIIREGEVSVHRINETLTG